MNYRRGSERDSASAMPATDKKPIQSVSRQSRSHTSLKFETEELMRKLSSLKGDPSSPTHDTKAPPACGHDSTTSSLQVPHSVTDDSGYGSLASTPDTNKGKSKGAQLPARHPWSRDVIDKPIPERLQNRFLDFKILYTEALWKAVSGKRNKNIGDISMKLRYKRETDADAQLFIVVQCEKRILKGVKKFFDDPDVKEVLGSDFHLHFIDSALIRLFSSDLAIVSTSEENITGITCGTAIEIHLNGLYRRATIGGLISVTISDRPELYALTAGHPLASLRIDGSSEFSSDSGDESSPEANEDLENSGTFRTSESQETHNGAVYNAESEKREIGIITTSSFHSREPVGNHDWALIKIQPSYWQPNLLHLPSTGEKGKQPLVDIDNGESQHDKYDDRTDLRISDCINPSKQLAAAMTCRGLQRGTLASNHSALFMSPSNDFVETLDFMPALDSSLMIGDSGSWVINESTGEVYGHIVAVDGLGEAHVMPIHPTLRSIESQLMATKVDLPLWPVVEEQKTVRLRESSEQVNISEEDSDFESIPDPTYGKRKLKDGSSKRDYKATCSSLDSTLDDLFYLITPPQSAHASSISRRKSRSRQKRLVTSKEKVQREVSLGAPLSPQTESKGRSLLDSIADEFISTAHETRTSPSNDEPSSSSLPLSHDSGYSSVAIGSSDTVWTSPPAYRRPHKFFVCPHTECALHRDEEFMNLPWSQQYTHLPFEKQSAYNKHLKVVHNETPFPCPVDGCERVCARGYTRERDLQKHLANKHPGAP
ncbi:hypothetical protein Hte_005752 [Hypoxylon texense]